MKSHVFFEGGGPSKGDKIACRAAVHKLLQNAGITRAPGLTPCGGRDATFKRFQTAHKESSDTFVAMLVDSEDPVTNIEKTWDHLKKRDDWDRPAGAVDEQVFLMTTCMETWIVADPDTLKIYYGKCLQENALPSLVNLESRNRHDVQDMLSHATRNCSKPYAKGKRSFEVLAVLNPLALEKLPSFARMIRILKEKLG